MRNVKNLSLCVLMLALVNTAAGSTLYVPSVDYPTIQEAIDAAFTDDEIEVAPGTYTEAINFKGKAIRLYSSYGPDETVIDASGLNLSVVTCENSEGANTILEGFTITGGNAYVGGGMYNRFYSSPTVTNCIFSYNYASENGGGMFNLNSSPNVYQCTFIGNTAAINGGGMHNYHSRPTVTDCTFSNNYAENGAGGGMCNRNSHGSNHAIKDCTFSNNYAENGAGGGMCDTGSSSTINCTFINNSAYRGGGWLTDGGSPTLTNCTFSGNIAYQGGGMVIRASNIYKGITTLTNCTFSNNYAENDGGGMLVHGTARVTNCILWGDTPNEIIHGLVFVTYCNVQGGESGTGNIDVDPMFADADGRLLATSPCIDAGNDSAVTVTTDLDGNPRIQGLCVDMGAFEAPTDPEPMLALLRSYILLQVDLGNIDAEMEVSLLAKVNTAISALARGNANDAKVAMNDLKALVNQVEAQTDKKIGADAAAAIIDTANLIVAVLGG